MSLDLQHFLTSGERNYIAKHNQNVDALQAFADNMDAQLLAAAGATVSVGSGFSALFGTQAAIVGKGSYAPSTSGTDLTVQGGYFWRPSNGKLVRTVGATVLPFSGVAAATYYLQVDSTGVATRSVTSSEAVLSIVWTGAAFGAITQVCQTVWGAQDWLDAEVSAALGASYRSLDDRLEAGETIVVGVATEVVAARNSAAHGAYGSLDLRLEAIDATLTGSGGNVVGPSSAVDSHLAQFDGTTGKLLKDGIALDPDATMASNSDAKVASQKATKSAIAAAVAALVNSSPGTLDTLKELADALGDDPNYATTIATALGLKAPLASPAFTGNPTSPTPAPGDNDTSIATTAFVEARVVAGGFGTGDVVGPGVAVSHNIARFNGTTGKLIEDSGLTLAGTNTGDETATTISAIEHAAGTKSAMVDADEMNLRDSAASFITKRFTLTNLKAFFKTYFDTVYAAIIQPFDIFTFYSGIPTASALMYRGKVARALTIPANFAGFYFDGSANATASTVIDIQKNGVSIGTVTIAAGGLVATGATTGGAAQALAAGDRFAVILPATPDATLADPAITFAFTR